MCQDYFIPKYKQLVNILMRRVILKAVPTLQIDTILFIVMGLHPHIMAVVYVAIGNGENDDFHYIPS